MSKNNENEPRIVQQIAENYQFLCCSNGREKKSNHQYKGNNNDLKATFPLYMSRFSLASINVIFNEVAINLGIPCMRNLFQNIQGLLQHVKTCFLCHQEQI